MSSFPKTANGTLPVRKLAVVILVNSQRRSACRPEAGYSRSTSRQVRLALPGFRSAAFDWCMKGLASNAYTDSLTSAPVRPPESCVGARPPGRWLYLKNGRLAQVLPQSHTPDANIHAMYPQRHQLAARVRVLVDFMALSLNQQTGTSA